MLLFGLVGGLASFSAVVNALPTASNNSILDLGYAQYQGISNSTLGITIYWGLQYAAPPTGALRWRPPLPIENSTVFNNSRSPIINATAPGYQCVQSAPVWVDALPAFKRALILPNVPQREDCLRLDVIVPNSPTSSSLPIIVQIHGGGYTLGNSQVADGRQFVAYSNGSVIYVQIQYRLDFYGFLSGQAVLADGVANAGLLDQREALMWVQRNAAKFGGDPTKVTIWGGSAGGGSVTAQMQLYGGETNPPFRAAIAEYPWWQPFHNDSILEAQYDEMLQASNCTDLACLRGLSADALAAANNQTYILGNQAGLYGYGDFYAGPSVDGEIIQDLPSVAFSTGRYSQVALLSDREGYEGSLFTSVNLTSESQVQPDLSKVWQTNSTSLFTRMFELYPLSDYGASYFASNPAFFNPQSAQTRGTTNNSAYWQRQSIFGDCIISCPTYYISSALAAAATTNNNTNTPTYKMVFYAGSQLHAATARYFVLANKSSGNATLAAQMKSYFLGFAVNLDPNSNAGSGGVGPARPRWPTYLSGGESGGFQVLWVNTTEIGERPDPDASGKCDFWKGQGYVVRN